MCSQTDFCNKLNICFLFRLNECKNFKEKFGVSKFDYISMFSNLVWLNIITLYWNILWCKSSNLLKLLSSKQKLMEHSEYLNIQLHNYTKHFMKQCIECNTFFSLVRDRIKESMCFSLVAHFYLYQVLSSHQS